MDHSISFQAAFSRIGESIYASIPELNLTAGSQESNEKTAKIKAVMRLVSKIFQKMILHKKYNSLESIFAPDYLTVPEERKKALTGFDEILNETKSISGKFLVLEESVSVLNDNVISYELKKIYEIEDPAELQANKQNLLRKESVDFNRFLNKDKCMSAIKQWNSVNLQSMGSNQN